MSEFIETIPEETKPVITGEEGVKPKADTIVPLPSLPKRSGIVTPSEEIVREPIGKGIVGLKETKKKAPMAGLTDRVPVATDKRGQPIFGTLEEEGLKDLELQKNPMPFETFKEKVFSGEITRASPSGSPYVLKNISDILKKENIDPKVKSRAEATLRSFYNYSSYKDPTLGYDLPFGVDEEFKPKKGDNPRLDASKEEFFNMKKDFLNVIRGKVGKFENVRDQQLVEQKLLNRISTGNTAKSMLRVAVERINEIPRAIPTILPYAKYIFDYAAMPMYTPELWDATREQREKTVQEMKEVLTDSLNMPLLMDVMNEAIVEELEVDLKNGDITQDKFDELTKITVGEKTFTRQFVDENLAVEILDKSFQQLSDNKKIGIYLFETAVPVGGANSITIKLSAAAAKKNMQKVRDLVKKSFLPKESQRLLKYNDIELLDELKNLELARNLDLKFMIEGINVKSLGRSMELDLVTKNAKKLNEQAYLAGVKYRSLIADPNATEASRTSALRMYRRYYAQQVQDNIKLRSSPVLREGIKEIAPLTAALYVGQEYLGVDGMGGDTFTGELLGVAFYMLSKGSMSLITGRVAKGLDGYGGNLVNNGAKLFEDITGWLYTKTGGDAMPKGWLANRSQEDYERLLGRKLKPSEQRGFDWTQKLVGYMGEENATIVMENLKRDFLDRRAVADIFPEVLAEGQKGLTSDEAYKLLAGDVGETSRSQWLQTAVVFGQKNLGAFDGANPKAIQQITDMQKQLETSAVAQSKTLERILEAAKEQGIDLTDNEIVQKYIEQVNGRVKKTRNFNEQFAIRLKEKLDLYIDQIEKNPSSSSKAGFIQQLKDADLDLEKLIDASAFDEIASIDSQIQSSYKNLGTSLNVVKSNRKNIALNQDQFANTAEKFIGTTIDGRLRTARVPFTELDKQIEESDSFIDIGRLVRSLVDDSEEFKDKPLSFFFSKDRAGTQFFDSPLNKRLRKSFISMAERSLAKMPSGLRSKIEEIATIKFADDGSLNPLFINEDGDFDAFDLVLKLTDESKNAELGLGEFKPFAANAFEVNAVRSAFRDYAYKIKDRDPELSKTYIERKDELDALFAEKMPQQAEAYKKARTGYKAIVFDDQDLTNDFNKIQSGVERIDENPEGFNFIYSGNKNPGVLFDGISDLATKYITSNGDATFLGNLRNQFKLEARSFQDKTDKFVPVFDLTTPTGVEKFNVFKQLLQEKLYFKIGREYFDVDTKTLKRQREKLIAQREGGYNFDKQADQELLKDIDNAFVVDIIDPQEGRIPVSINPLADLIEETKDISVAIENSFELQTKLKNFVSETKIKVNSTRETVMAVQKAIERDLDLLSRTLGDRTFEATPSGFNNFFIKHVIGGTPKRIAQDKQFIMKNTDLSQERVDELYEYMTGNGMLEYGGRTTVDGNTFKPILASGDNVYEVFATPAKLIRAIEDNPNSSAVLRNIMSPQILSNVSRLMKLVNNRRKLSLTDPLAQANTNLRKISQNELASRGYNIARDMVSPLYVTTEFALRIASQHGINVMNLAVTNEKASELLVMILENPSTLTKADIDLTNELIQNFVVQQLARQNVVLPDYTPEGLEALRKEQAKDEGPTKDELKETAREVLGR